MVVLPAPLGTITATSWPWPTENETLLTARSPPKSLVTASSVRKPSLATLVPPPFGRLDQRSGRLLELDLGLALRGEQLARSALGVGRVQLGLAHLAGPDAFRPHQHHDRQRQPEDQHAV